MRPAQPRQQPTQKSSALQRSTITKARTAVASKTTSKPTTKTEKTIPTPTAKTPTRPKIEEHVIGVPHVLTAIAEKPTRPVCHEIELIPLQKAPEKKPVKKQHSVPEAEVLQILGHLSLSQSEPAKPVGTSAVKPVSVKKPEKLTSIGKLPPRPPVQITSSSGTRKTTRVDVTRSKPGVAC